MGNGIFVIGERYRGLLKPPLKRLGVKVLWLPANPNVSPFLAGHADLSVFCADARDLPATLSGLPSDGAERHGPKVFLAPYLRGTEFESGLAGPGLKPEIINEPQGKTYPRDVPLNICLTGGAVIANRKTASPTVIRSLEADGYRIVNVKQGYPACATLVCGGDAVISADPGICSAAESAGLDVLRIAPGYIDLPGFDTGFIGGCAFMPKSDAMAFTGSLKEHSDGQRIKAFLKNRGIKAVQLTEGPLLDIGGAVRLPVEKGDPDED